MFLITRRAAMIGAVSVLAVSCGPQKEGGATEAATPPAAPDLAPLFEALEKSAGGRLGAYVLDTGSGLGSGWRVDERFAHCSSFKMSLAAMFLKLAESGDFDLSERLHWTEADLLPNSDISRPHTKDGMTIRDLAHAALVFSDNTAANVLLKRAGGPFKLTEFWRSLGDNVSRLDRYEPALNEVPPGTELDTSTPAAMAQTVAKLVVGDALKPPSRDILRSWMIEVETGARRLRAGLPKGWIAGDKTGTGLADGKHSYVDLAFAGPPQRKPLIVTAYFEPMRRIAGDDMDPVSEAVLAEVGRIAAENLPPAKVATFSLRHLA